MDGGEMPSEARRAPRAPKQRNRAPAPAEGPEGTEAAARGPHAVLEGKVKALKEKRGAGRPGGPAPAPERPSPKKPRPRRAKPGAEAAPEPRARLCTYLTDGLLDGGETGSGASPCGSSAGGPWRMPGAGSGAGGLSLAQRVERNRRLLQEVLALVPGRAAAGPPQDGPAHELPASDADWDSGVSLPDAEGCRASVPGPELALSPRHEQAKQLLQRARMKARTNPLRASHDILPAGPREPGGTPAPEPKRRDGEAPAGGSLSDSSSGESSGGPRRARGPSPSRVRFEDESARDAEARYLERLQLRQRRALDAALSSPARGPPLAKPGPAGGEGERPSRGPGRPGDAAGPGRAAGAGGKCKACGSYLGTAVENGQGERHAAPAPPPEPRAGTLGPRGSPLWILPSRQRIHTERIKETYIGDTTRLDDADSALESTDTSDGCRTDSEEGRPRGARRHGTTLGTEPVAGKPERHGVSASPQPRGPDRPQASPPCAAPPLPGKASGQEDGVGSSPRRPPDSPLCALSTNNCNNTQGRGFGTAGIPIRPALGPAAMQPAGEGETAAAEKRGPDGSAACGALPESPVRRKGSGASAVGLRKLLCSLSQGTKQRLGRFRCYSMEQLAGGGPASPPLRKAPSLQSLASPFCQPRKASSVQNLRAAVGKAPRASAYLVAEPGVPAPRRTLSVEDIGAPDLLRAVGRLVEVFPDGTSQLELQRPPDGTFGFRVASGHGRPDTGVYVQEMADASTAKLYAGLLAVGDEILQVNGAAVSGLGLARIRELLLRADTLSLRVLRQRPAQR
ncbi:uncharacterized protein KIAA1614 homolog [Dromaius novaehollandiae]|uniref:uncharacterized protein KIAA1614 homolog n=1 Tax=Dromaius novaehollandiae TaxID=8790 RepID=UPI00311F99A8